MNCQDIALILDDGDARHLDAGVRRAVEAHLQACGDCARDWKLHARLVDKALPAMPAGLATNCRSLVVSGSRPGGARRVRARFVVIGSLAALAAVAAVMLGLALHQKTMPRIVAEAAVAPPSDGPNASSEGAVSPAEMPASPPRGNFSVQLRLQYESTDALVLHRVREYYEAFAEGLRAVPGLHLVNDDVAGKADFRVTISNPGPAEAQQDPLYSEWVANTSAEVLNEVSSAAPMGTVHVLGMVGDAWRDNVPMATRGPLSGACDTPRPMPCSPAEIAERQVMALRKKVFPRDGSLEKELEAQFLSAAPGRGRDWVMSDLLSLKMAPSDAMVREALARMARPQEASANRPQYDRGNLLALLAGLRHPEMLEPLIDMARHDSVVSRTVAVRQLAAEFPEDPAVRAVMEEIVADPSSPAALRSTAAELLRGLPGR